MAIAVQRSGCENNNNSETMLIRHRNTNNCIANDAVISLTSNHIPLTPEKMKRATQIQREIKKLQKKLTQLLGGSFQIG
jgi:hypothetical protein